MVGQDDEVEAAVQVQLLQAVHQLAHDPVHAFQRHLQLWGTRNGTNKHELRSRLLPAGRFFSPTPNLLNHSRQVEVEMVNTTM